MKKFSSTLKANIVLAITFSLILAASAIKVFAYPPVHCATVNYTTELNGCVKCPNSPGVVCAGDVYYGAIPGTCGYPESRCLPSSGSGTGNHTCFFATQCVGYITYTGQCVNGYCTNRSWSGPYTNCQLRADYLSADIDPACDAT
jgi:hypothetical protein